MLDLSAVGAGFSDEALGSQRVFRAALRALARPGQPVEVFQGAELPRLGYGAAAILLLALLDADCRLWLSPALAAGDAAAWLRFHTGCTLVPEARQAHFLWIGQNESLPPLVSLNLGSDTYPDQSATCVVEIASYRTAPPGWTLRGPGINGTATLSVEGLSDDFTAQWMENHALFPRGVDLFLVTPTEMIGLPRTIRISNNEGP